MTVGFKMMTRGRDRVASTMGSSMGSMMRALSRKPAKDAAGDRGSKDAMKRKSTVAENQIKSMSREVLEALVIEKLNSGKPITPLDIKKALEASQDTAGDESGSSSDLIGKKQIWPASAQGLSAEKKQELEDDFEHFDLNKDGKLSLDEFIKVMQRGASGHDQMEEGTLIGMFQDMNTSGSGYVNFTEFAESWIADDHGMHDELHDHAHALEKAPLQV